jgi:hypothetical protein
VAEPAREHAPSGVNVRRVLALGALAAVVVILIVVVIRTTMRYWVIPEHAAVVARPAPIPPVPRLQPSPGTDLGTLRAQKSALLSTWQWSDPAHRFARIPIERAMTLYAQGVRADEDASQAQRTAHPQASPSSTPAPDSLPPRAPAAERGGQQ